MRSNCNSMPAPHGCADPTEYVSIRLRVAPESSGKWTRMPRVSRRQVGAFKLICRGHLKRIPASSFRRPSPGQSGSPDGTAGNQPTSCWRSACTSSAPGISRGVPRRNSKSYLVSTKAGFLAWSAGCHPRLGSNIWCRSRRLWAGRSPWATALTSIGASGSLRRLPRRSVIGWLKPKSSTRELGSYRLKTPTRPSCRKPR